METYTLSVSPSPTTFSTVVVSSSSSRVSSSSSAPPACFSAPANYVANPGFEAAPFGGWGSGDYGPWYATQGPGWKTSGGVNTGTGSGVWSSSAYNSNYGLRGTTTDKADQTFTLLQKDIIIPAGTKISVTAMVRSLRFLLDKKDLSFRLTFDGVEVETFYGQTYDFTPPWTKIGSDTGTSITVGSVPNNAHQLSLVVTTKGHGNSDKNIFSADNFAITPVAGPNNAPICS